MKALYSLSADPIHFGHLNIIERAAKVFDYLVVGIAVSPGKSYTFTHEEHIDMAKRSIRHIHNAEVLSISGLAVDYAYEYGIPVVVRGVRNQQDYEAERELHENGATQKLGIETFLMFARPELALISSTSVKAMLKEQGVIRQYVPLYVQQRLQEKLLGQYILGLTGEIGSGKSYVGEKLEELAKRQGMPVHNVDLDVIGHRILEDFQKPAYVDVRNDVAKVFGKDVMKSDGTVNRKALGEIVFSSSEKRSQLNQIMSTPLDVGIRKEIYGKKGLILLNASLIVESDLAYLCNNNSILVHAAKDVQRSRLNKRDQLSPEQIERRLNSQFDYEQKKAKLEELTKLEGTGRIWEIDNSSEGNADCISELFEQIISDMKIEPIKAK